MFRWEALTLSVTSGPIRRDFFNREDSSGGTLSALPAYAPAQIAEIVFVIFRERASRDIIQAGKDRERDSASPAQTLQVGDNPFVDVHAVNLQFVGVTELQTQQRVGDRERLIALRAEQIDEIGARREIQTRADDQNLVESNRRRLSLLSGFYGRQRDVDGEIRFDLRVGAMATILVQ